MPDLEVSLELVAEPVAQPDLSYEALVGAEPVTIDALLDGQNSYLSVQWQDGTSINLDHSDLDRSVSELAGSQPGLKTPDAGSNTRWDGQLVLKGSVSNDSFTVAERPSANPEGFAVNFIGTSGSDVLSGTPQQDLAYYRELDSDSLSGLYISDHPEQLPLVADNLPPLIAEDFEDDNLLVYKNYGSLPTDQTAQIDLLKSVEVLALSPGDDILDLSTGQSFPVVDFGEGQDFANIASLGDRPDVTGYAGLEKLDWTPLDSEGKPLLQQAIHFDVQELQEDATKLLAVGEYPPASIQESNPWTLSTFALPGDTPASCPLGSSFRNFLPPLNSWEKAALSSAKTSSLIATMHH